jgi:hypothetical protein
MGLDTTIFGKKTVSDVLKEIYDNSKNKEKQINALIGELKPLVENIGDAFLDEHLIKMVALVQRLEGGGKASEADFFNPEELAKLMEQSEELGKQLDKKDEE